MVARIHGAARSAMGRRYKRSHAGKGETTRNWASYSVIFVWGASDMTPRRAVLFGRREAIRYAKERAQLGAKIVLVKKGSFNDGMKLSADFSTVGGA